MPKVKPLGPERNKQIGEARGEAKCGAGFPVNCKADADCSKCRHATYPPYSSDLNVCMRLVGDYWEMRVHEPNKGQWSAYAIPPKHGKIFYSKWHPSPALAMIDAITRAFLEVRGE